MGGNHLFIVSTPLHLIVSLAIIDTQKIERPHLIFIDQVKGRTNPYFETLQRLKTNPFASIHVFYRPETRLLGKLKHRKKTFVELEGLITELKPTHIYVGNDRRIEFQFCMHKATEAGLSPTGYYMDEGTFTYVGRKASETLSDKVIDNISKKIFYGSWWQHPATVGASSWITTVFASFPDLVHPLLKNKQLVQLTLEYWQSGLLKQFCAHLIDTIGRPEHLQEYDLIITMPHESVIASNQNYKNVVEKVINQQVRSGSKVGVKYHPRDTEADLLKVGELPGVELISQALPFETLLPMIKVGAKIIGDFSTTLISTRLLRPDLAVEAIDHGKNSNEQFMQLYEKLGIKIIHAA